MMGEGPTTTGSIVGKISGDTAAWDAAVDSAKAKADELRTSDPTIHVKADTAAATTKMAEVTAAQDRLTAAQEKVISTSGRASLAQMRLDAVLDRRGHTDYQVAAAEFALQEATNRESSAIDKAVAANLELIATREKLSETSGAGIIPPQGKLAAPSDPNSGNNNSNANSGGSVGYMGLIAGAVAAVITTGQALTSFVVGVTGGFAMMGAAGVLAVLGIQRAMADGTAVGAQYTAGLATLDTVLHTLEDTAATDVLGAFDKSVVLINGDLPVLNGEIGQFATLLGDGVTSVLQGVITGMQVMNPLFVQGAQYVNSIAAGFDKWTSDGGLLKFTNDAMRSLPIVATDLGAVVKGVVDFIGAMAPGGAVVLNVVGGLGDLLSLVSKLGPVLPAIAIGGAAAFAAFKLMGLAEPVISGVGSALVKLGFITSALAVEEDAAASSTVALGAAAEAAAAGEDAAAASTVTFGAAIDFATGPLGTIAAVLGAVAAVIGVTVAATQENTSATTDYTAALQADNDAIGKHVTLLAAQSIQQSGVMGTAASLGLTLGQMTAAITGNAAAYKTVTSVIKEHEAAVQKDIAATSSSAGGSATASNAAETQLLAYQKLGDTLGQNKSKLDSQQKAQAAVNQASNAATASAGTQRSAVDQLTTSENKLVTAQSAATTAAQTWASFIAATSNDSLKLAQAQDTLAGDYQNLSSTVASNLKTMSKAQATSLDTSTATGLANHQIILQSISDSEAEAQAVYQSTLEQTGSKQKATAAADAALAANDAALAANAGKAGLNQQAVQALINTIVKIPANVTSNVTVTGVSAAAAAVAAYKSILGAIPNSVNTSANFAATHNPALLTPGHAHGGFAHLAAGGSPNGFVSGPGSATSDSIMTALSNREFVTKASSAAQVPHFLSALNRNPRAALGAVAAAGSHGPGHGSSGPVMVSLAGATLTMTVDGVPMKAVIQQQIVQAEQQSYAAVSGGAF